MKNQFIKKKPDNTFKVLKWVPGKVHGLVEIFNSENKIQIEPAGSVIHLQ